MEERLIEQRDLENGLVLEFHDASKILAGDRWLVSFVATIDIDVNGVVASLESASAGVSSEELLSVLGDKAQFRYEKQSYFVDMKEKDAVFSHMKKDFLDTSLTYLNRPEFAEKFLLRSYQKKKPLYPA